MMKRVALMAAGLLACQGSGQEALSNEAGLDERVSVEAQRLEAEGGARYIVKFRDAQRARGLLAQGGARVELELSGRNAVAARIPAVALEALRRAGPIEYIEEDVIRAPLAQSMPYGIPLVQADQLFATADGSARKVCIIDSGFSMGHADLQTSGVTGYPSDWSLDTCGHGTHVAGTIAALDNGVGVVGVNPSGVNLHIVKIFDGAECGWSYASTLVNALDRCVAAGANIVNMSLGGSSSSVTEQAAFQAAYDAGVLSIAAAGNDGSRRKSYPASYPSVVSVAAVDANKVVASFSQKNDAVELAAPGVAVLSSVPWADTNEVVANGSTFAGGYVTGAARSQAGVSGATVNGGLCDAVGAWSGRVVLCQRGTISFVEKVNNVVAGGGVAAVIYNNVAGDFAGTLGEGVTSSIPSISLSLENGQALISGGLGGSATVRSFFAQPGSGYEAWDGTSMATPHVAGVAAAVWSHNPSWTNAQVRAALTSTAEDLGAAGRDTATGYGLVRAKAALDALQGAGSTNQAPVAAFTASCSELTCTFSNGSTDADGTVATSSWNFGDGTTSTATSPSKTFGAAGTYTVTLSVTDNDSASDSVSQSVTVSASGGGAITLTATAYKAKGKKAVDLSWAGATGASVDVYRDGSLVITTANDGFHTDTVNSRGGGSNTYEICEAGTNTCSPSRTVTF